MNASTQETPQQRIWILRWLSRLCWFGYGVALLGVGGLAGALIMLYWLL